MAIREVLVSFTFEQQRQMINLIGVDVGDVSTLLTPTNEVVSGINEIVNGDVDLINQTHGMDPGTLSSPSLYWDAGQGFYKVDANKIGLSTGLAVTGNLEVDGNITFRAGNATPGTLTFGDLDTDNVVFNADINSSIIPDTTASWNLGSDAQQWNNIWIDGTASIDTLTVDENSTFTGYLQVDSGDIRVPNTQTTVDLFDDYATVVEAFGDATTITIGQQSLGTITLRNRNICSYSPNLDLFNTNSTTVNFLGAAETINMGLAGNVGLNTNLNILSDDVVLSGDLAVNGGEILSSQNTIDLFITQGDVRIGALAGSGTTTVQNTLKVQTNIDVTNSATDFLIKDNESSALTIKEGTNDYIKFTTTNSDEKILIYKDVYVIGNLDITGTTTTIGTTNLQVDDKNIELGVTSVPSDALADGGGITLKGTTDKTITYNNTSGNWETNIGLRIANAFEVDSSGIMQTNIQSAGNITLDSTAAFTSPKIVLDANTGNATLSGTLTSNGITQYTLPTIGNGGQLGYDDGTKSLRLYANSSTSADAKIQFHFNQSGTASMTFDQGGAMEFPGQTDTAATGATTSGTGLAHYEEGTWSPDFLGLSSAFTTYHNKVGTYVRIGSWCHVQGFIQLNGTPAFTAPNDPLRLGPLPFNYSNQNVGYYTTVGGVACQSFNFHDNDYSNTGQVACGIGNDSGTSYVVFQVSGNNNVRGIVQNSAIGTTNCVVEFQLSYRV